MLSLKTISVVVGNIGTVFCTESSTDSDMRHAVDCFNKYKWNSENNYGRAASEDVTLFVDGEPEREHFGTTDNY